MRILVGADGTVKDAIVITGLPYGLDDEALEGARKMKFKPAMKDGTPVDFWVTIQMEFNLRACFEISPKPLVSGV
jgi:TonB family protein